MPRKGSINEVGIKTWIDQNSPKSLSYAVFRRMREQKASIASMARTWGVDPNTLRKWMDKDDRENGRP